MTSKPGWMIPGMAVVGWISSTGEASVKAFNLPNYNTWTVNSLIANADFPIYNASVSRIGDISTLKFTAEIDAGPYPLKSSGSNALMWALGEQPVLFNDNDYHKYFGSFSLDLAAGSGKTDKSQARRQTLRTWHGALMMTAYLGLFPLSILVVRNKFLLGSVGGGKLKARGQDAWYIGHRALTGTALGLVLSAFILAVVEFRAFEKCVKRAAQSIIQSLVASPPVLIGS